MKILLINKFLYPKGGSAEPSVCYVGRLSKEKGVATLMDAMKRLPGVRLKVIGDGPLRETLEKKCRDDGMKNVMFFGYQAGEALMAIYRQSMGG